MNPVIKNKNSVRFGNFFIQNPSYFLKDFKSCTTMKIRITDNDCETSPQVIYTYNMSGSTAALNFVNTP